jgi:hypothetical protein
LSAAHFAPTPLQGLRCSYGTVRPSLLYRYSRLAVWRRLSFSLRIRSLVPAVPHECLCPTHAPSTPVAARPVIRHPADLSQDDETLLVLTTLMFITTRLRKVHFRSSFGHPPARISSELFIRRSPPRLFTAAARTGLRPAPESRSRRAIPIIHAALRNGVSSWRTPFVTLQHTLVDKNEPGRIKKTLLSYPTSACSRNVLSLPFSSLQAFF